MNLYKNDSAQSGTILMIIIGLFIMGIVYVMLGSVMNGVETVNNDMINQSSLTYSQDRWNMIDTILQYWWSLPIYFLILFIAWGIKKAIDKQSGVI